MDFTSLAPSHKRTSSGAENLNTDQPPFKRPELSSSSSSSSDEGQDDDSQLIEGVLEGVYIVQYSVGNMRDDVSDNRIIGVYVSEEDAIAEVAKEKAELIQDRDAKEENIQEMYTNGWSWDDEFSGKNYSCSVQFHKLIWPSGRAGSGGGESSASSASSSPDPIPGHGGQRSIDEMMFPGGHGGLM